MIRLPDDLIRRLDRHVAERGLGRTWEFLADLVRSRLSEIEAEEARRAAEPLPPAPPVDSLHDHFKGGRYRVLGEIFLTATDEMGIRYRRADGTGPEYSRSIREWYRRAPDGSPRYRPVEVATTFVINDDRFA
jgi:hypothetical protein